MHSGLLNTFPAASAFTSCPSRRFRHAVGRDEIDKIGDCDRPQLRLSTFVLDPFTDRATMVASIKRERVAFFVPGNFCARRVKVGRFFKKKKMDFYALK